MKRLMTDLKRVGNMPCRQCSGAPRKVLAGTIGIGSERKGPGLVARFAGLWARKARVPAKMDARVGEGDGGGRADGDVKWEIDEVVEMARGFAYGSEWLKGFQSGVTYGD